MRKSGMRLSSGISYAVQHPEQDKTLFYWASFHLCVGFFEIQDFSRLFSIYYVNVVFYLILTGYAINFISNLTSDLVNTL